MRAALATGLALLLLGAALALAWALRGGRATDAGARAAAEALVGPALEPGVALAQPAAPPAPVQSAARTPASTVPELGALARVPEGEAMLLARLVDARGAPLARIEVDVALRGGASSAAWLAHTDGAGRLRVALSAERRAWWPRSLQLRGRGDLRGLGARLALDGAPAQGATDLGDVAFAPVPVLAAGSVWMPSGAPGERANVQLRLLGPGDRSDTLHAVSAADGAFELRGWHEDLRDLELSIHHPSGLSILNRRIPPGLTGLVIRMETGGCLAGRVLLDGGSGKDLVSCTLIQAGAADVRLALDSGRVRSGRIPSGSYTLRVMVADRAEPLLEVEGVAILNGVVTEPPEINPLDLRGRMSAIPIRVTDEDGEPLEASLRYRPAGGGDDAWRTQRYDPPEPVLLRTGADALDVEAAAPGMRTMLQKDVRAETTLRLRRGPPVLLVLRQPPQLPADCVLRAKLRPAVSEVNQESLPARFEARGAQLAARGPGAHEVVLSLENPHGYHGRFATLSPVIGPIQILDVEYEQTFFIDLDQASIDQVRFEQLLDGERPARDGQW